MIYLTIKGLEPNSPVSFPEVIIDGRLHILVGGYTDCNGCIIIPLKRCIDELIN